jgi:uncharacterized membrane protein YoaK (UPF0700 family)
MVDAVTYLALGHVFAANMTGNIIVLGFALAGAPDISVTASLVSLASFFIGAMLSGHLARALGHTRQRWIVTMFALETTFLALAALVTAMSVLPHNDELIVGILAIAMGMRSVTARRMGISDVSTIVVTLTLSNLAADALLPGATYQAAGVRLFSLGAILVGAAAGALVLLHLGPAVVLTLATVLVLVVTIGFAAARTPDTASPQVHVGPGDGGGVASGR